MDGLPPTMPTPVTRARLQLAFAAFLFSTGGAAIKAVDLDGPQVACLRSVIAAAALLAFVPAGRRLRDRKVWLVAIAYAATLFLFVCATKLTTSLNAIGLQSTAPLWLALFAPLLLRESVRRRDFITMIAIAIGMVAFVASGDEAVASAPNPALGNLLGAACGFTWTFTLIGLRSLARADGPGQADGDRSFAAVVAGNLLGAAFALPFAWPIPALDTGDVVGLVYLGVFQIGLAYVCIAKGMARVRALDASLLLLIEPMLNPVWTYFVHGERPTALACVGAAIILAATTVKSILDARATPPVGDGAVGA